MITVYRVDDIILDEREKALHKGLMNAAMCGIFSSFSLVPPPADDVAAAVHEYADAVIRENRRRTTPIQEKCAA